MHDSLGYFDAVQDPNHPSYKVPGLLAWFVLALGAVGTWFFPHIFLAGAQLFTFYMLVRLVVTFSCYLLGIVRCYLWETRGIPRGRQTRRADGPDRLPADQVHHVVLIPNYQEPMEVLQRTLQALAEQDEASRCLTIVLAMEQREAGAYDKACVLRDLYADRFAHILITLHPGGRPGEVAGKGSNQAWAARQAKQQLVEEMGMSLEQMTLTSCDADSVLHPRYYADLSYLFANDPQRHLRFWSAPINYRNNMWQVPAPIRLLSLGTASARLAELAGPLSMPFPLSTYTLSFRLADQVGYWDPAVISEDWHMYLRCFFATSGRIGLTRVFLPISGDAVHGETILQTFVNYYHQKVRHAWGAEDVGYILQQWRRSPGIPFLKKLRCLVQVTAHHLLWSTTWFLLAQGFLLSIRSHVAPMTPWQLAVVIPEPFRFFGLIWLTSSVVVSVLERIQSRPDRRSWRLSTLVAEAIYWLTWPIAGLLLYSLPALQAQTKLLFGGQLMYRRTSKVIVEKGQSRPAPSRKMNR